MKSDIEGELDRNVFVQGIDSQLEKAIHSMTYESIGGNMEHSKHYMTGVISVLSM